MANQQTDLFEDRKRCECCGQKIRKDVDWKAMGKLTLTRFQGFLDSTPPHAPRSATSRIAAHSLKHRDMKRVYVLAVVVEHWPVTRYEIEVALGWRPNETTARVNELLNCGLIEVVGRTESLLSGMPVETLRATPRGRAGYDLWKEGKVAI